MRYELYFILYKIICKKWLAHDFAQYNFLSTPIPHIFIMQKIFYSTEEQGLYN